MIVFWYDKGKEGEGGAEGIPETIVAKEDAGLDSTSSQIHVDGLPWFVHLIKVCGKRKESVEAVVKEGSVSFSCLHDIKTMEEIFPVRFRIYFTAVKSPFEVD